MQLILGSNSGACLESIRSHTRDEGQILPGRVGWGWGGRQASDGAFLSTSRFFIPSYTSQVLVQLRNCRGANQSGEGCPLGLKVRGKAPPLHNSTAVDCRGRLPCRLGLELPFWQNWYYVLVEKSLNTAGNVNFQLVVQLKGEWRSAVG